MGSIVKEVSGELSPFLQVFKDGSVERFMGAPIVQPNPHGVSSKDIMISKQPPVSARIYLPKLTQDEKLPILVYFHGGAFCIESAYSLTETTYMNALVSKARIVAVSIEYRLAPEHLLPVAFEDCWAGLQWVASHHSTKVEKENNTKSEEKQEEEWISKHGDFDRFFIGGDSAGANIAHNMAMKIGAEGLKNDVKLVGFFVTHPFFWGSKAVGSESDIDREQQLPCRIWSFLYPSAEGGIDNPMMNPAAPGAPSLAGLPGSRLLVSVAEKDVLRNRGVLYYKSVKESGWKGEVELIEVEGEDHAFHILKAGTDNANDLIQKVASFLLK